MINHVVDNLSSKMSGLLHLDVLLSGVGAIWRLEIPLQAFSQPQLPTASLPASFLTSGSGPAGADAYLFLILRIFKSEWFKKRKLDCVFRDLFIFVLYVFMFCLHVHMCTMGVPGALGGQQGRWALLDPECWRVMNHHAGVANEPGLSARATWPLNH